MWVRRDTEQNAEMDIREQVELSILTNKTILGDPCEYFTPLVVSYVI